MKKKILFSFTLRSVKTLFDRRILRQCVLNRRNQHRALPRKENEEMKILVFVSSSDNRIHNLSLFQSQACAMRQGCPHFEIFHSGLIKKTFPRKKMK